MLNWRNMKGKAFADKGYIGEKLAKKLFENGIHLITKIKKKMKNKLMLMSDKILQVEIVEVQKHPTVGRPKKDLFP